MVRNVFYVFNNVQLKIKEIWLSAIQYKKVGIIKDYVCNFSHLSVKKKKKKAFSPEILQPENQQVNDTRG